MTIDYFPAEKEITMKRRKFGQRGFTLVELVFVVAIILVLAGIFLPLALSKLEDADRARADADLQSMAASLTTFFTDVRRFPACNTADCDPLNNSSNDLKILVFKTDTSDVVAATDIPATATASSCTTAWNAAANLVTANPDQNNAFNHLVVNNPNGDVTSDDTSAATGDYKKFKGPYIGKVGKDPFGQFYVAHIGAIEKDGIAINSTGTGYGWILSAGADAEFQTCPESTKLAGDDRGFIFATQ